MARNDISIRSVFQRSVRLRCPHCGIGKVFSRWTTVNERCPVCGCDLLKREGDCWFVFYMSTAFLTGIIVVFMFLIAATNVVLGYSFVGVGWLVCIVATHPYRKSLAIGIDYLIDPGEP